MRDKPTNEIILEGYRGSISHGVYVKDWVFQCANCQTIYKRNKNKDDIVKIELFPKLGSKG